MKIDIMRNILMKIDAIESGIIDMDINLTEFSSGELKTYCEELAKEGFIESDNYSSLGALSHNRLTDEGRNFVKIAKNQVLWKNAKKSIKTARKTFPSEDLTADIHEMKFHFISLSN